MTSLWLRLGTRVCSDGDFLRANRCQWNWEHNVLEIDGQEIRCRVPLLHDIPTEEVRAVKTYVIPARTEMVIEGQLGEGTRTLSTGMLTSLPRFMGKRQLGVAAILARRRGRIVPVRVLNPSSRKRTVVIGDALASYQAVEGPGATGVHEGEGGPNPGGISTLDPLNWRTCMREGQRNLVTLTREDSGPSSRSSATFSLPRANLWAGRA